MISRVLKILKTVYLDILFAVTFLLFLYLNGVDIFWLQIAACGAAVFILLINIKYYLKHTEKLKAFLKRYLAELTLLTLLVSYLLLNLVDLTVSIASVLALSISLFAVNSDYLRNKMVWILGTILGHKKESFLIILSGFLMILVDTKLDLLIFVVLFISFLLYKWDSRVMAFGAIICLSSCPPLLFLEYGLVAEQMAVYAYYFLFITVILQIVEFKRET